MNLLPVLMFLLVQEPRHGVVLYFNDAHEMAPVVDTLGTRGGVARVKTILDRVRLAQPGALVVFGGDLGGGSLFGALFKGAPMVAAFNALPVDVANFGQHDFDFGVAVTQSLIAESKFPWISSNLVGLNNAPFAGVRPYLIKKVNGLTLAFLGFTDAMNTTTPDHRVRQRDMVQAAKEILAAVALERPDGIIAVTQASLAVNEELLQRFPSIDAIVTEEISETQTVIRYVDDRPILMPRGNMGSVVRLDFFKSKDGALSLLVGSYAVDEKLPFDPALLKIQNRYQSELQRRLAAKIATLNRDLDAGINGQFQCRWEETNVGNLIADAYRAHFNADLGLMNGGGIRANVPAGNFTLKQAYGLLPFGNPICDIEASGAQILKALEHGVSQVEKRGGQFLHLSGGSYRYNWGMPPGNRVVHVTIGKHPLLAQRTYRIALPLFLVNGGDGFDMFKKAAPAARAGPLDVDILVQYCRNLGVIDVQKEGRIQVLNRKID